MLEQAEYAWTGDESDLRRLVGAHPWVTMVSATSHGPVVSHLPVVVDPDEPFAVLGHLPRSDAREHELGDAETVLVVQGPHGYVSATWYVGGPYVSTWNYVVAHLHGRPVLLDAPATMDVLVRTQDHFESRRQDPFDLSGVADYVDRLAPAVVGFRLEPSRVAVKAKLSQDKPAEDVAGVLRGLEDPDDVHADPALAAAMRVGGLLR